MTNTVDLKAKKVCVLVRSYFFLQIRFANLFWTEWPHVLYLSSSFLRFFARSSSPSSVPEVAGASFAG
jgi:hypothetical protein